MDAGGLPMMNCLLQHTLRSLCNPTTNSSDSSSNSSSSSSSSSSKWVYSVFWRILPRNYPPPKWDHGGSILDRAKGNKRNWILVWEDGFCDFCECERAGSGYVKGRFGADIFFKMSHEVYNFGEGLVGKVASDNSHKWVYRDCQNENDPNFVPSWSVSIDPQPRAWDAQFSSGIQTIAVIAVREGLIQLGSFHKVNEDLNLVISIQRKFSYLQSIPGIYAIQRPYLPIQQNTHTFRTNLNATQIAIEANETAAFGAEVDDKRQLIGSKRLYCDRPDDFCQVNKSINLGYHHSPYTGISNTTTGPPPPALWSIPPLLPSTACNPAGSTYTTKIPSISQSYNAIDANENARLEKEKPGMKTSGQVVNVNVSECAAGLEARKIDAKMESSCALEATQEAKPTGSLSHSLGVECRLPKRTFRMQSEEESALNLN
ncbi:OLC1v1016841C1 [Oldenlandia corymbosa var. corymbosa]|uniref:OLC1v1016841C1 n=1 Tax=Oldenlandia corymbosa var. corymbosa TaxID=529605 RepID=A0AAV1E853_OLDCO|nr:OLC1v1016841C1 [Oldenlandia corymbosa var. corymbosa]